MYDDDEYDDKMLSRSIMGVCILGIVALIAILVVFDLGAAG